jgi:hypothetical protein
MWQRIAIHLGAGRRLLGRLPSADASDVEAVLDPGGSLEHAVGIATQSSTRDALRSAVKCMDQARTRSGRRDALGLSENTVSAHLRLSLKKLQVATRAGLVRWANEVALAAATAGQPSAKGSRDGAADGD